jgi:hypothetical protein
VERALDVVADDFTNTQGTAAVRALVDQAAEFAF